MTNRPIIFSAPMILSLLADRKTMTRRIIKPQPWLSMSRIWHWEPPGERLWCDWEDGPPYIPITDSLAMDQVGVAKGDCLWVRETWCPVDDREFGGGQWIDYRATPKYSAERPAGWENDQSNPDALKWRPSIHMPRWASRLTLEVTGVKVERVQEISREDAEAEGIEPPVDHKFSALWNSLHGPGAWERNEWVYALTFNVHKCNIDTINDRT